MAIQTIVKTEFKKSIFIPFTLEQIAFSLNRLSERDLEVLEELADKKFQKTILSREKDILSQFKRGETISLKELQKSYK